jgi:hypothetical protein
MSPSPNDDVYHDGGLGLIALVNKEQIHRGDFK